MPRGAKTIIACDKCACSEQLSETCDASNLAATCGCGVDGIHCFTAIMAAADEDGAKEGGAW